MDLTQNDLKPGTKVHYIAFKGAIPENGIIKSYSENTDYIFVVYECGENWDYYEKYTGQSTMLSNLKLGWI